MVILKDVCKNGLGNTNFSCFHFYRLLCHLFSVQDSQGRLLFLTFIKTIINGTGFYYVEPQTRDNRRMDLVVNYGKEEFVVELKIWRGGKYEERGRDQLAGYLATRGLTEGYLVTFDFSKKREKAEPHWIENMGKRIFEVTI